MENQKIVVDEVLGTLDLEAIPQVFVFNKIDKLSRQEFLDLKYEIRNIQQKSAVFVSALNDKSLEILKTAMRSHLHESFRHISMKLMAGDGENLAILHEFGEILKQEYDGQYTSLEVRIPHRIAGRLLKSGNVTLLEEHFVA